MRVFLIAGEASGDRLGAALMAGLTELAPEIEFDGVGGPMMQGQGLTTRFPMDELTVFGIAEVLPKYRHLKRRIAQCADWVIETKPDALVTIDSPDFGLRVAARVRAAAPRVRTVHYVAPSVWAWRPKRAEKMARHVDHVLALLPFEPPLMEAAGMRCDFVGHPVTTEPQATDAEAAQFRADHDLVDTPMLLMLPGSRRSEVTRLAPVFGDALERLSAAHPRLRAVLPAAQSVAELVVDLTADWPRRPLILDPADTDGRRAAFRAADVALAASGTVSLELAAAATSMVIAYDMSWLSWQIMHRALRTDTVTLVNLVDDSRTIPEFLGPACRPEPIADAVAALLTDATARDAQIAAMDRAMIALGRGAEPPGLRAARAVLDGIAGHAIPASTA